MCRRCANENVDARADRDAEAVECGVSERETSLEPGSAVGRHCGMGFLYLVGVYSLMEKPRHVMREAGLLLTFDSPSDARLLYEVIPRCRFSIVPVRPIADHCARARSSGPCPRAAARAGRFPGGVMAPPLAVDPRRSGR